MEDAVLSVLLDDLLIEVAMIGVVVLPQRGRSRARFGGMQLPQRREKQSGQQSKSLFHDWFDQCRLVSQFTTEAPRTRRRQESVKRL